LLSLSISLAATRREAPERLIHHANMLTNRPVSEDRFNPDYRPTNRQHKERCQMRYAAYIRTSSDDQIGNYSIDAQKRAIEAWIAAQGGVLVATYVDEAQTGRTADRPAFQAMRRDARERHFDAVVVHKFDRFARNRTDALALKSLLRYDYGVKLFSVSEPSEDSDGPAGALIEGILESVADWYSANLATEVAKGKRERSHQGIHNNQAPFGLKKNECQILIRDETEFPGLLMAFEQYATGKHSDNDIAGLLNKAGYRSKTGRPFSKETVRDILQNQTYLGKIKYQEYRRHPNGSRSSEAPVEWFEGQHEAVIDKALFQRCQEVRAGRRTHRQATPKYNPYLLRNLVYCWRCWQNKPEGMSFPNYGKMRPQAQHVRHYRYYRCRSNELGYHCDQKGVQVDIIDNQVIDVLMNLEPPEEWPQGVTRSMSVALNDRNLEERLAEIRTIIQRMDKRWDHGFITDEQQYLQQRRQLQLEVEQLTRPRSDELDQAVDLLQNFRDHWHRLDGDEEKKHELVKLIVERVYVAGETVVAITLRSGYQLVVTP
jgi:site-specific DNA recombinase